MNSDGLASTASQEARLPWWRLAALALLLLSGLVAWLIYSRVLSPAGMMSWDEAGHALRGLVLARDIQAGDWSGLLYDIYRQVYWPPTHTAVLGGAFVLFGSAATVARNVSLVFFLLGAAVIYGCGLRLAAQRGLFVALVAAALYLTAPALTPYAGQVMLEMPALAALYLAVWIFLGLTATSPPLRYAWLGLAIVLTFLTKLNYGALLMLIVGAELVIRARGRPRALYTRQMLALLLAVLLPLALWFAYPPKLWRTWEALINQPFGSASAFSAAGLLFYPRALVGLCGSPLLFALFVVGFVYAVGRSSRDPGLRVLVLIVLLQFLSGQLHQTKVERHLFPLLPALFLCTACLLANLPPREGARRYPSLLNAALAGALILYSGWLFLDRLEPASTYGRPAIADQIAELITGEEATLLLSTINLVRPAPPQLDWMLAVDHAVLPVTLSDVAMNLEQDLRVAALAPALPGPPAFGRALGRAASRSRGAGPVRTLYVGLSDYTGYSQSPAALYQFLEAMHGEELFSRVLVVTPIDPTRAFVPLGHAPYPPAFLIEPVMRLGFTQQHALRDEQANVQVLVYE